MSFDNDHEHPGDSPEMPTEKVRKDGPPVYVLYKDKHPDPSDFPPNTRFVREPGWSSMREGGEAQTHLPEGFFVRYAAGLNPPKLGENVERGQVIGRAGASDVYPYDTHSGFRSLFDRYANVTIEMDLEEQREYMLHVGPRSKLSCEEIADKARDALGVWMEGRARHHTDTSARPYVDKLGDPGRDDYDKGH